MAHSDIRPTLPPIRSLDLPTLPHIHEWYDMRATEYQNSLFDQRYPLPTPVPTMSPSTPSQPAPCFRPCTNAPGSTPAQTAPVAPLPGPKVRLVPTSFENANAVLVVQPPSAPNVPPPQPVVFVGPALARLRDPQRRFAKGTRFFPYRVARPTDRQPPPEPSQSA